MASSLTRSSSCGVQDFPSLSCRSPQRSESFGLSCSRRSACPTEWKCTSSPEKPIGDDEGEWALLKRRLRAAFFERADVSADHPAAKCLERCDFLSLRDELFSSGIWKRREYTRSMLMTGKGFNVMLLCWAPGCSSPVHGHSCVESLARSNCFMFVLEGTLAETVYPESAIIPGSKSVDARAGRTRHHKAGEIAYINDSLGLHKVGNPFDARAVSVHVYAPGWSQAPLYDEYYPEVDAGGAEFDCGWGDF